METRIDWELIGVTAVFAGLVLVGALAIRWAKRYRQESEPEPVQDLLETYQAMLDAGEIDEDEFERIRARLEGEPVPAPPPADPTALRPGAPPYDGRPARPPDDGFAAGPPPGPHAS